MKTLTHPLQLSGTGQLERFIELLIPENFKIDGHTISDLIAATHSFAGFLQYYNDNNEPDGDWACFWKIEPLFFLAIVGSTDIDNLKEGFNKLQLDYEMLPESEINERSEATHALALIEYIKQLAHKIEFFYQFLPQETSLKHEILELIRKDSFTDTEQLSDHLKTLIGYHKEAYPQSLIKEQQLSHLVYKFFFNEKHHWGIKNAQEFYKIPHISGFQNNGFENIKSIFTEFYKVIIKIKSRANYWFEQNIKQPKVREPHVALFLAFLYLFNYVRDDLNELNRKHLEYYYKQILHLKERPAVPDEVKLIFELSQHVNEFLVKAGTELLGGKDKNNNPLIFKTIEDWVVSKAKVKELKNCYLDAKNGILFENPDTTKSYFENNELPNVKATSWRAFGDNPELPEGEIGFAIASPQLILREGKRTINCKISLNKRILLPINRLSIEISTKDGLEKLDIVDDKDKLERSSGAFFEKIPYEFAQLEAARRIITDLIADVGILMPYDTDFNLEIKDIIQLKSANEINFLTDNIYLNAYHIIAYYSKELSIPNQETAFRGELNLIRAYCYWILAKVYAPPFDADSNEIILTQLPKAHVESEILEFFTLNELYDFILKDCSDAEILLSNITDVNTANKYAAKAFYGRVLMQMGEFAEAIVKFNEIIDSGDFSLTTKIEDVFTNSECTENIWVYNFSDLVRDVRIADFALFNWSGAFGEESTIKIFKGSAKLRDSYDKSDLRVQHWFKSSADDLPWSDKYRYQSGNKIILIRFAEIYLNAAICSIMNGDVSHATHLTNQIKNARGLSYSEGVSVDDIIEERFKELAFEGDRKDILQTLKKDIPVLELEQEINWNDDKLVFKTPNLTGLNQNSLLIYDNLGHEVEFHINLENDFSAIDSIIDTSKKIIDSQWPVLKISTSNLHSDYWNNNTPQIKGMNLNVDVSGIKENLIIQSDQGVFNGTQKFLPFGPVPEKKAKFYIGSTEVFQKGLNSLTLNFDWIDPVDFSNHYNGYGITSFLSPELLTSFLANSKFPDTDIYGNQLVLDSLPEQLSGRVMDKSGTIPLSNIKVTLTQQNNETLNSIDKTTDINGNFNITTGKFSSKKAAILSFTYEDFTFKIIKEGNNYNAYMQKSIQKFLVVDNKIQETITYDNLDQFILRDPRNQNFSEFTPNMINGFMRFIMINYDFMHKEYPKVLMLAAISASKNGNGVKGEPPAVIMQLKKLMKDGGDQIPTETVLKLLEDASATDLPNQPYTPTTNGISLDYTSNQEITIGKNNDGIDRFYHILPFNGYAEVPLDVGEVPLLYPYSAYDKAEGKFAAGNLFIGVEHLKPGGSLSLLIHIMEGTESDPKKTSPDIYWSYLAENNQWKPFAASQKLKDTTYNLTRSGIVQLMLPYDIVNQTTLFEGGLYWIRVAAVENKEVPANDKSVSALPDVVDIRAQVIEARFDDRENSPEHLANPLPEGTVTKLLQSNSNIKKIEQPFPSVNGQLPETGNEFYRRVSERLRHKDRGVTIKDYEQILLQKYPKIQRAKCLSHTKSTCTMAPGSVLIAVIPNLQKRNGFPNNKPRFSEGDLREMEEYMRSKSNLFVAYTKSDKGNMYDQYLYIENPNYETIQLDIDVIFKEDVADIEYHIFLLDEELCNYLSPWLKDKTADICFSRSVHRSRLVYFIEERPYIDKVERLDILQDKKLLPTDQEEIHPSTPYTVFTTFLKKNKKANETNHEIYAVDLA